MRKASGQEGRCPDSAVVGLHGEEEPLIAKQAPQAALVAPAGLSPFAMSGDSNDDSTALRPCGADEARLSRTETVGARQSDPRRSTWLP